MFSSFRNKWLKMPIEAKSSLAFAISSLFLRGITFLVTPIFTRVMDPSQYGIIVTYNAWNSILEVVAIMGLTYAGVVNTGLNEFRDNRDRFLANVLVAGNISTAIVFFVVCAVKSLYKPFILPYEFLIMMFIRFIFQPAQVYWITRNRYEYRYKAATVVSVVSAVFSQALSLFLVVNAGPDSAAFYRITGSVCGGLLFYIPIYFYLIKRGAHLDRSIWKWTFSFAIPLIPHYLAQHAMAGADRIMISEICSSADAAVYGIVSTISLLATIVWSAVNASIVPFTYNEMNNGSYDKIRKIVSLLVLGYGIVCVGVALVAPEIIRLLGPSHYYSGVYAVPPIAGVAFLNALYNLYANIEFYYKKKRGISISTIVACIFNVAANAMMIPRFGFVAAAYTTLLSNILLVAMHYYFYKKSITTKVYNDKMIVLIAVVCIILCEMSALLYKYLIARYTVVTVVLFIMYVKRNAWIKMLKKMKG